MSNFEKTSVVVGPASGGSTPGLELPRRFLLCEMVYDDADEDARFLVFGWAPTAVRGPSPSVPTAG